MIRLLDKYGNRAYNWDIRQVGGYILLSYEWVIITPLIHTPARWETVIGRVAA